MTSVQWKSSNGFNHGPWYSSPPQSRHTTNHASNYSITTLQISCYVLSGVSKITGTSSSSTPLLRPISPIGGNAYVLFGNAYAVAGKTYVSPSSPDSTPVRLLPGTSLSVGESSTALTLSASFSFEILVSQSGVSARAIIASLKSMSLPESCMIALASLDVALLKVYGGFPGLGFESFPRSLVTAFGSVCDWHREA
jgi:hypothetical protein